MDQILSEFISHTGAEPSFARDFLDGHNWDLVSALKKYTTLCNRDSSVQSFMSNDSNGLNNDTDATEIEELNELPFLNNRADIYASARLSRGFSSAKGNNRVLSCARQNVANDFARNEVDSLSQKTEKDTQNNNTGTQNGAIMNNFGNNVNNSQNLNSGAFQCYVETPSYTFTLPNFANYSEDFRKFLEKDLIETATSKALENTGYLNWWADSGLCQKLWPLATTGDGNCLLHAASLGMWGFHDRLLMLRKALHLILTKGSRRHALWRRWRWQQSHQNKEAGLIFSEEEWRREWENIVRLASPQPRSKPTSAEPLSQINNSTLSNQMSNGNSDYRDEGDILYESLEEIHVFALAHVLKRPIMIIADTVLRDASGEAFAPILFGGIYLPLECYPSECHRSPLVLCYDAAHFSALVPMQPQNENSSTNALAAVPITDKDRRLLPLHFCCDPGPDFTWWSDDDDAKISAKATLTEQQKLDLIDKYMDLAKLTPSSLTSSSNTSKKFMNKYATLGGQLTGLVTGGTTAAKLSLSFTGAGSQDNGLDASDVSRRSRLDSSTPSTFERNQRWRGSTGSIATHRIGRLQKTYYYLGITRATLSKFTRSLKKRLKSKNRSKILSSDDALIISTSSPLTPAGVVTSSPSSSLKPSAVAGTGTSTPIGQTQQPKVTLNDLRDASAIVAAKLHTEAHHQFMNEMIDNYLTAARQRFDAERNQKSASTVIAGIQQNGTVPATNCSARPALNCRRERLSRSFSATSVLVKCMNGNCDGQGSHLTNFLCDLCFKTQKQLMESFTTSNYYQVAAAANQTGAADHVNKACTLPFRRESPSQQIAAAFSDHSPKTRYQTNKTNQPSVIRSINGVMSPVRANGGGSSGYPVARSTFYTKLASGSIRDDLVDNNNSNNNNMNSENGAEFSRPPSVTVVQPLRMTPLNHNLSTHSMTSVLQNGASMAAGHVIGGLSASAPPTTNHNQPYRRCPAYRSIETRYGVNSVTTSNGVTHYFVAESGNNNNNDAAEDERQILPANGRQAAPLALSRDDLPIAFCSNLRCPGYDPRSYSLCAKCSESKSASHVTSM